MSILISNLSLNGATVANDIGVATGADTPAKIKTLLGTTDGELTQLENITASGLDGLGDGVVYKRLSVSEKTQVDNVIASGLDAITDGTVYKRVTISEKTRLSDIQAATGATTALKLANLASPASTTQQGVALLGTSGGAAKLTKWPDGATAVYSNDEFPNATNWSVPSGDYSAPEVTSTPGAIRVTRAGTNPSGLQLSYAGLGGKTVTVLYRQSSPTEQFTLGGGGPNLPISTTWSVFTGVLPVGAFGPYFRSASGVVGQWFEVGRIWIGDYSYLAGSLSEEAARIADQLGDTAGVGVAAGGVLTIESGNASAGDYFEVGGKRYTFRTDVASLTAEGDVLLGATYGDSAVNMAYAIRRYMPATYDKSASGADPRYYCASANALTYSFGSLPAVGQITLVHTATPGSNAPKFGILGNQIAIAKSGANLTVTGAATATTSTTLAGGIDDVGAKIKTQNNAALGYVPAGTPQRTSSAEAWYFGFIDVASGASGTLPAGGTFALEVLTYGATYNSVMGGIVAGGALTGTASANLRIKYTRLTKAA